MKLIESIDCRNTARLCQMDTKVGWLLPTNYRRHNLKAAVLLGEEAWAASSQPATFPEEVLFFGGLPAPAAFCFLRSSISRNTLESDPGRIHQTARHARKLRRILQPRDICRNIDLIRSLYPEVIDIAFVTDNTYEDFPLQAQAPQAILRYPELQPTLI